MADKKLIVTHSSKFHTDDIFAVATLLLMLEKTGESADIIRTRDMEIIKTADYVADVGGIYDESKNLFDHHQEGGAGKRDNGIPFSSFGLVWKRYGVQLCGNMEISNKIDCMLVQPVDAYDNGIQFNEPKFPELYPYDLKMITRAFRPTWREGDNLDEIFSTLVLYAKYLLSRQIKVFVDAYDAKEKVRDAYNNSADKRVVVLDERYPWEDELLNFPEVLFVVYPKIIDNTWSIKTVAVEDNSYISRKDLPESWAGKCGEELENITGVQGSIFCHNRRFLAVAKTKEAILKLAEIALNS